MGSAQSAVSAPRMSKLDLKSAEEEEYIYVEDDDRTLPARQYGLFN